MTFDPIHILEVLAKHDARFVVIGGIAAAALGSPSTTVDLDVCYEASDDNLERLAAALRELGARLRGVDDEVPFKMEAQTLRAGDHFTFTTDVGDLDIFRRPAGMSRGYEELLANAIESDLDGFTVKVCSLEDLMKMKQASGRRKDEIELEVLHALRDELEQRAD